ncbi:MAG: AAA family ATPase, partial [Planctomycetota bacterium]
MSTPQAKHSGTGSHRKPEVTRGILEVGAQGFGFLRDPRRNLRIQDTDVYVGKHIIQRFKLKTGHYVVGVLHPGRPQKGRGPSLQDIRTVDGDPPALVPKRPYYKDLTSIDPTERFRMGELEEKEQGEKDISMRLVELITPIGRGQRALVVAPPRTGKTVLLQKMARAVAAGYPEVAVLVLLVDERPEEVTDWRRNVRGEVYSSSADESSKSHVRVAELVLQRCQRLLEAGRDVFLLLDSLTRLGRA